MNSTAAGRVSERGPGKRGRVALKGPFRPSSPQASYRSLRHKWQSSFIPLRLLSPRKAFRLPQGPLFPGGFWVLFAGEKYLPEGCLSASQVFTEDVPLIRPSSSQAAYRSARRKRPSCVSLSPPQAAGLVHSAARPLPSSPQASYRSLRHKWQSSFISLRLLSPRKAYRLPRGPHFASLGFGGGPEKQSR